jgi:hypothetical protein
VTKTGNRFIALSLLWLLNGCVFSEIANYSSWPQEEKALYNDYMPLLAIPERHHYLGLTTSKERQAYVDTLNLCERVQKFDEAQQRPQRAGLHVRRQCYISANPELDSAIKEKIERGQLMLGMSPEQARASWGIPSHINRTAGGFGVHEQWVYGASTFVYFENDKLTAVQTSE